MGTTLHYRVLVKLFMMCPEHFSVATGMQIQVVSCSSEFVVILRHVRFLLGSLRGFSGSSTQYVQTHLTWVIFFFLVEARVAMQP